MKEVLLSLISAASPILVALIGIIPSIVANRIQTQKTLQEIQKDNTETLKNITGDVKTINESIDDLKKKLTDHVREDEWNTMKQARIRIIRFSDELSADKHRFSKAHFDEIIDDINTYQAFCDAHKDFKNNKGKACMDFIQRTHEELMATDGFAR